jgi:hypothetical protein
MCEFVTSCRVMSEKREARAVMSAMFFLFVVSCVVSECVWRVKDGSWEFVEGIL